jgi:hypothetical protein
MNMARIHFGTRDIPEIMFELEKFGNCVGEDVDYTYTKTCIDKINQKWKERGKDTRIELRMACEWDKTADYRIVVVKKI